jgi:hypothetical protein
MMMLAERFQRTPSEMSNSLADLAFDIRCMQSMGGWEEFVADCKARAAADKMQVIAQGIACQTVN